ncbi:MAG: TerC family protein [Cytophagales bacterium]|nr:MAG: TerC family protein [Cytophagales bacterium]
MLESLLTPNGLISLATLTLMEIVLGIDNLLFISVLSDKLPKESQGKARSIGLALALIMRIALLWGISWIVGFSEPLVDNLFGFEHDISIRDLILLAGGLFLIYKSTIEIHEKIEGIENEGKSRHNLSLTSAIFQIVLLDIVFSFDSILTAIGLVNDPSKDLLIMVIAIVISLIIMLLFAKPISDFVNDHPTIKMLALSFLLLIGILLVAEAFHQVIPKGYIYFSIAFSLLVETLNMWSKKKQDKKSNS